MPDVTYKVDDFGYLTDGLGRVVRTRAFLKRIPGIRNGHQQTNSVPWKDGDKAVDDGGHIIAARFLGPGEQINYYPLKKELNRSGGDWHKMESFFAKEIEAGKTVEVEVRATFDQNSQLPQKIVVTGKINGVPFKPKKYTNI